MTVLPIYPALLLLQARGNPLMAPLFMYAAIFAIFYFILIRPQQKQRKAHDSLIRALQKGDEIVTAGGVIGDVIHIKETLVEGVPKVSMDDRVTIKSGESRLVVERGKIARVIRSTAGSQTTR
jgi:preprotein translocase subunit YajC